MQPSVRPTALRSAAVVGAALALCPLAAAFAGDDPRGPVARAEALVAVERDLRLLVEPGMHAWLTARPALAFVAQQFYVWVHLPAAVGALVWVWLERPRHFRVARDTFVLAQLLTVLATVVIPVAPPRLVPDLGFRDLLASMYGSAGESMAHSLQSPFAAVPSGHIVFATISGSIVAGLARPPVVRLAGALYPLLVALTVMATGNHLWLDAVAALAVTFLAYIAARARRARGDRPDPMVLSRTHPSSTGSAWPVESL